MYQKLVQIYLILQVMAKNVTQFVFQPLLVFYICNSDKTLPMVRLIFTDIHFGKMKLGNQVKHQNWAKLVTMKELIMLFIAECLRMTDD